MNSLRKLLSSDSLVKVLVLGAALPIASVSCSEPDKAPAEAAFSISQSSDPAAAIDGDLPCAATPGRLMFPEQEGTLTLTATTPETTVTETMNIMVNGKDEARISCSVKQTGDTTYEVSANIAQESRGAQYRLSGVSIVDGVSTAAQLSWQYQLDGNYTGPCTVQVDTRGDASPFIEPGSAKLSYECKPFKNTSNQRCIATGTIFLRNCSE